MTRKVLLILIAALLGSAVGAGLGYGPLLRYQAEGVLAMDLTPVEYKHISEIANASSSLHQALAASPLPGLDAAAVSRGDWHSPVPKLSMADTKQIPAPLLASLNRPKQVDEDLLARLEQERLLMPYLGLRLTYTAHDAEQSARVTNWLGDYLKDVALRAMLRDLVTQWRADGRQFAEYAALRKRELAFQREQASGRAKALKTLVATYPEAAQRDVSQVVDVRNDNAKYTTPLAQMVAAEREIIDIDETLRGLERRADQEVFAAPLAETVDDVLGQARDGREAVRRVTELLQGAADDAGNDARRERLAAMSVQVAHLAARFLERPHFVAAPSAPSDPVRPGPRLVIALGGLLAVLLAAAWLWRDWLRRILFEDDDDRATATQAS